MELVVHFPEGKHGLDTLNELVAEVHGEYIYSIISGLQCETEEKIKVLRCVEDIINTQDKS